MSNDKVLAFIDEHKIPMIAQPNGALENLTSFKKIVEYLYKDQDYEPENDYELFYKVWKMSHMPYGSDEAYYNQLLEYLNNFTTEDQNILCVKQEAYSFLYMKYVYDISRSLNHAKINSFRQNELNAVIKLLKLGIVDYMRYIYDKMVDGGDLDDAINQLLPELFEKYANMRPYITKIVFEQTKEYDGHPITDDYIKILKQSEIEWCDGTSPLFIEYIKLLKSAF